jgi:hypothetical protein
MLRTNSCSNPLALMSTASIDPIMSPDTDSQDHISSKDHVYTSDVQELPQAVTTNSIGSRPSEHMMPTNSIWSRSSVGTSVHMMPTNSIGSRASGGRGNEAEARGRYSSKECEKGTIFPRALEETSISSLETSRCSTEPTLEPSRSITSKDTAFVPRTVVLPMSSSSSSATTKGDDYKVGDAVSIYSQSANKWLPGSVVKTDGRMVGIEYPSSDGTRQKTVDLKMPKLSYVLRRPSQ